MANNGSKRTEVAKSVKKYDEDTMRRAAYALNMCTVSVGQIVDYNDQYILEQEYNAILNNLNLEAIPDDEAFLKILVELLNTITFFRIQDKRKKMIEKQYQKRMKNAIWSAVPNIGVIVASGDPKAMLFSLATQIGAGYMNYRKEKANITNEREKEEFELDITAIEQFNAIQRELFTTAWRIAKEYKFPDNYRITERQIKQYNEILMDVDEQRKFVRLESVKDNFYAYPPFWYYLAHTAVYIAGNDEYELEEGEKDWYIEKAKTYFEEYNEMNKYNILRQDQITASFALEYVDLLLQEDEIDMKKVKDLLSTAVKMSGCSFDIMQICAVSYLKIGELGEAAILLKQLVNENYNLSTNAKLLSRVYVTQYLHNVTDERYDVTMEYKALARRVNDNYLFRMPISIESDVEKQDSELQGEYLKKQKALLTVAYRKTIVEAERKLTIEFNRILFPSSKENDVFFDASSSELRKNRICKIFMEERTKQNYFEELMSIGIKYRYLDILNRTLNMFEQISLFRNSTKKDGYARLVRKNFLALQDDIVKLSDGISKQSLNENEFLELIDTLSFENFTDEFFANIKKYLISMIESADTLDVIETAETDLLNLCEVEEFPAPEIERVIRRKNNKPVETVFFEYELFGDDAIKEQERQETYDKLSALAEKYVNKIAEGNPAKIKFILRNDEDFESYFSNESFNGNSMKAKTIAILDDRTIINDDLLFMVDGIAIVSQNELKSVCKYSDVKYDCSSRGSEKIIIGRAYELSNAFQILQSGATINIKALSLFIKEASQL